MDAAKIEIIHSEQRQKMLKEWSFNPVSTEGQTGFSQIKVFPISFYILFR